jgi:20S proteasome subunit alpha 2
VIATEKKSSSILIDESMLDKVSVVCPNIGIVYSGMGPDFRVLVAKARKSAQAYWKVYGEYPPTRVLTQELATVMQQATQSGYGAVLLERGLPLLTRLFCTVACGRTACRCSSRGGTHIGARACTR